MDSRSPSPGGRRRSVPGYTFGNKLRIKDPNEGSPGPGSYCNTHPKPEGPAYTIHARFPDKPRTTPGPGAYDLLDPKNKVSAPRFTFGSKHDSPPKQTPGPAQYNPHPAQASSMAFTMGKKVYEKPNMTPGPGDYCIPNTFSRGSSKGTLFSKPVKSDAAPSNRSSRKSELIQQPIVEVFKQQQQQQHDEQGVVEEMSRNRGRSSSPESQFAGWSQKSRASPVWQLDKNVGKPAALRGGGGTVFLTEPEATSRASCMSRTFSRATCGDTEDAAIDYSLRQLCDSLHEQS